MSIQINYTPKTNESLWESVKNGSFVVIIGNEVHPLPEGLYRIFIVDEPEKTWILIPMFDGEFAAGMFPYMMAGEFNTFPTIKNLISKININAEV
jgi:hypothetical protein